MASDPHDFEEMPNPDGEGSNVPDEGTTGERNLEEKEVHVVGVFEHKDQNEQGAVSHPFVLIRDNSGRCVLIWVSREQALSISMGLEGATADRPQTHDLLKTLIDKLDAHIERIVVDDLWGETFYAKIWMTSNGNSMAIDSRPSDAIALALRAKVPVFMTEAVLEEASRPCDEFEEGG